MRRDSADDVFSQYIRRRDNWTCQRCGKRYPPKHQGFHCCHFIGRSNEAVRFDPDNAVGLDFGCHKFFDEKNRPAFVEFMKRRLGENAYNALLVRASRTVKKDRKMSLIIAKELYKTLED